MSDVSHLQDIEAEQALLGAVLVNADVLTQLPRLAGADFFEPLHGGLFEVMRRLHGEGRPLTPVTIMPDFEGAEPVGELSVKQYLGRLAVAATTTINAGAYASVIRDFAARRALFAAGLKMQQLAGTQASTVAQTASEAVQDLDAVMAMARAKRQTHATGGEWAAQLMQDLRSGGGARPVPSGLIDLDRAIGGFRFGEYHIIAARPSMGKSTLCIQVMLNAARAGYRVLLFSLEMGAKAGMMSRALSSQVWNRDNPIPYVNILQHLSDPKAGSLHEYDLARLDEATAYFNTLPFEIDDEAGLTVAEIGMRARKREAQLILIDHLGKIKASGRYAGNKAFETGEISEGLAELAKNSGAAVVVFSQLNRAKEAEKNKRPDLVNLRNSGDLEADADLVLFLYRHSYYLERTKEDEPEMEEERLLSIEATRNALEIIIGKQRNGPCISVDVFADMENNAIRNKLR